MNIREMQEEIELNTLSPYAMLSAKTKGRKREEKSDDMRTAFQRDRDRIIHSKAFRRLMYKTQVFLMPEGDHYRNRLIHTLEVNQIAISIATALRLNKDLTEAIALGHDLGHTPFGHSGEYALNNIYGPGFEHNEQSLRVVECIENDGKGLNLTEEVRDGILNHPTRGNPSTLEGKVVQISDKIAYINHDIEDAIRAKLLKQEDLPKDCLEVLGETKNERITTLVNDIVTNSLNKPDIIMSEDIRTAVYKLRKFMFENIYIGSKAKAEEVKAQNMITSLYNYFMDNPEEVQKHYSKFEREEEATKERMIIDYIAGMTDRYAVKVYEKIFLPEAWNVY